MALPVILIYDAAGATAVFGAAQAIPRPVEAHIPASVASAFGAPVLAALVRSLTPEAERSGSRVVVDCGDEVGLAMAVARAGVRHIRCSTTGDARMRLADICGQLNAVLVEAGDRAALDLADVQNPVETCRNWLEKAR